MFNTVRLHQLASACRDSVIGIQSDQLEIHKKVEGAEKQVEFFNDELVKHDENWTKVIGRMRKVWKNMKSEFAVTRTAVQSLHKRVTIMEKDRGIEYIGSSQADLAEQADDFENLVGKVRTLETALNELVDIVHDQHKKGENLRVDGMPLEAKITLHELRLDALEKWEGDLHVEHFSDGRRRETRVGAWK